MPVGLYFDPIQGARPERAIAFLHGILGRGSNLRTIAARFVKERPNWTAWLVDLRGHGQSPKGTPEPSIEAAAQDVAALSKQSAIPLAAVAGHSFGGKVALELARIGEVPSLRHFVVIDSVPGSRAPFQGGDSALGIIASIESLPRAFMSITDFVTAIEKAGQPRSVAQWLAGSLERQDGHLRFALDLQEIRALILDYFARDLWQVIESPSQNQQIHLIIGERSDAYSTADRQHAMRIAASNEDVTVDILPAGHWVHVEDPDGLMRTLLNRTKDG